MNGSSKGVYDPKAFILHAASLRQGFPHCAIFPVAATRRCTARVSVQLWLIDLSVQLPVIALVGLYPANKLIGRRLLSRRKVNALLLRDYGELPILSDSYAPPRGRFLRVTHPSATAPINRNRSTCMPKARRQRSSWTRIKSSKKFDRVYDFVKNIPTTS